jgi:hypothetical protein
MPRKWKPWRWPLSAVCRLSGLFLDAFVSSSIQGHSRLCRGKLLHSRLTAARLDSGEWAAGLQNPESERFANNNPGDNQNNWLERLWLNRRDTSMETDELNG